MAGRLLQAAAIALAALALSPAIPPAAGEHPAPAEVSGQPEPRGSILIDSDAAFTAENGVRGGSGTAEDPYVIAHWTIVRDAGFGVRLVGTRAHVLIQDVSVLDGDAGAAVTTIGCISGSSCPEVMYGASLGDAQNVTIRGLRVTSSYWGVLVEDSKSIVLDRIHIGHPFSGARGSSSSPSPEPLFLSVIVAVGVYDSSDVEITQSTFADAVLMVLLHDSERVSVEDSTFLGIGSSISVENVREALFARNVFRATVTWLEHEVIGVTFAENDFFDGRTAIGAWNTESLALRDFTFCGNLVEGKSAAFGALEIPAGDGVVVRGNRFVRNVHAVRLQAENVTFERNEVRDSIEHGFTLVTNSGVARDNSFHANGPGGNRITRIADARSNWWGDASGPSGVQPGSGDRLRTFGRAVAYEPWLTTPPDTAVDCVPGETRGAPAPYAPPAAARVRAGDADSRFEQQVPV